MVNRTEIDVRDIARVLFSGTIAYLAVHFVVLPLLITTGVSFPAYFYIGVAATTLLSVGISYLIRPRDAAAGAATMHPAE